MRCFKVLRGRHNEGDRVYGPGDVLASNCDLLRFNHPAAPKFAEMPEGTPLSEGRILMAPKPAKDTTKQEPKDQTASDVAETLAAMSVTELRRMAAEEEIDLGEATRKEQIIKIILASQGN